MIIWNILNVKHKDYVTQYMLIQHDMKSEKKTYVFAGIPKTTLKEKYDGSIAEWWSEVTGRWMPLIGIIYDQPVHYDMCVTKKQQEIDLLRYLIDYGRKQSEW
jgi:hypothetical protein